jgi:branched-chain amino acid aminotransferase
MEPAKDIDWDALTFAFTQTDMMYVAKTKVGEPWPAGKLVPYGDIPMSPAAGVLNYGQGIFEGLKAQRTDAGDIVLFRTNKNAQRFAAGAARLGMPVVSEEQFMKVARDVVEANARFVPPSGKGSLYVRPVLFGNGAILGLGPAPEVTYIVYCCPVGPYFKDGITPIHLKVSDEFHRVCAGSTGNVKAIANYAPGMIPSANAKKEGYSEIIYLDAKEHRYIEEVGAANFFCVKDGVIYTPILSGGTILPGVTRDSTIQIARDLGYKVEECKVDIDFALTADEVFCTGTAAVVSPVGKITHADRTGVFANNEVGVVTKKIYETLTGIQRGKLADKHGWVIHLKGKSKL